jgi:hypothetical protein
MAICPKCSAAVLSVNLEGLPVNAKGGNWNGVSYSCPSCGCVLGVGIDPVALKNDLRDEVLGALRKR